MPKPCRHTDSHEPTCLVCQKADQDPAYRAFFDLPPKQSAVVTLPPKPKPITSLPGFVPLPGIAPTWQQGRACVYLGKRVRDEAGNIKKKTCEFG